MNSNKAFTALGRSFLAILKRTAPEHRDSDSVSCLCAIRNEATSADVTPWEIRHLSSEKLFMSSTPSWATAVRTPVPAVDSEVYT